MPSKSKAQFRAMFALAKAGKISEATRREFTDTVQYADLPERKNPLRGTRRPRGRKEK